MAQLETGNIPSPASDLGHSEVTMTTDLPKNQRGNENPEECFSLSPLIAFQAVKATHSPKGSSQGTTCQEVFL